MTYSVAANPTCEAEMPSASFSDSRDAIAPTIVTSSPSRIHTVPSPTTTSQCHFDQGRRSSRAGIFEAITRPALPPAGRACACAFTVPMGDAFPRPQRVKTGVGSGYYMYNARVTERVLARHSDAAAGADKRLAS